MLASNGGVIERFGGLIAHPLRNGYAGVAEDHQRIVHVAHDASELSVENAVETLDGGFLFGFGEANDGRHELFLR